MSRNRPISVRMSTEWDMPPVEVVVEENGNTASIHNYTFDEANALCQALREFLVVARP